MRAASVADYLHSRPVTESDTPAIRELLASTVSINAHVAGVLDAAGWAPDLLQSRAVGLWLADHPVGVIVNGRVLRIACAGLTADSSVQREIYESMQGLIFEELTAKGDAAAVMGPEGVLHGELIRQIRGGRREFSLWEKVADGQGSALIHVPSAAQIGSFSEASYEAFVEELGRPPSPSPRDPAYLSQWERARREARILGRWDERGECLFRVEIRPVMGLLAELRGFWLHPRLRGTGMAREHLRETVSYVGAQMAPRVQVICDVDNSAAESLYRRSGFTIVGRLSRIDLPTVGPDSG